ncbi:MAG: hypothetical protein R3A13_10540 [Bdellovibrionota bacterium]
MKEIRDKVCGTSQDGSDADFSIAQVLILGELNRNWLYSTEPGNAWQLVAIEDQLMLAATSR